LTATGAQSTRRWARAARSGLPHRRQPSALGHAIRSVLLVLLALACASCQGAPSAGAALSVDAAPTTIRISGSTSMAPVLRDLADAYRKTRPQVRVEVLGNGSQAGMRELQAGTVDIAAVSWKAEDAETPKGVRAVPFARDGVAVVVHPSNRVTGLTLAQARSLYRGEIQDWKALGGPALETSVISREDGSGTRAAFEAAVMGGERVTFNALVLPTTQAVVEHVGRHPEAVGYVSMAALTDTVRAVPIEGLLPAPAAVRAGAYHLMRHLYLFTPTVPTAEGSRFLDFIQSPEGQAIIERRHVPLR
jgi:phosphate transport system substrate-binding protein